MLRRTTLPILLLVLSILNGDIIYENGAISGFVLGESPNSSYDNWISHVTEGIAEDGYNNYGPDWLDVQTNGFGSYDKLEENSPTLDYWDTIFAAFIDGDTTQVDSLLQDSLQSFFYELVIFQDTVYNRTFHIIREQLDTSYIDINDPENTEDNVVGAFRNGWGMFIINPNAERKQVIIQVPHPCDDFIAPYVALDIFLEVDSYAFMINGAGREVLWTGVGSFSNSKSLSDPSRYPYTVFQKFQENVTGPLINSDPHSPLVFAIHSFDNNTHLPRKSVILAAGAQNPLTNKPIRDISGENFDIINFTHEHPISEGQFNNPSPLHVTDYYEAFYDDDFFYDNGYSEFPITLATELKGPTNGIQMIDLQSQVSGFSVYEPWIHVELDEKPMLFDNIGMSDEIVYENGSSPTSIDNFHLIREYYQPFIEATESYLSHWEQASDNTPPDSIEFLKAYNMDNSDEVYLIWTPIFDTNFKSYQIEASQDTLFDTPLIFDLSNYSQLQNMRLDNQIISGLNNTNQWWLRIRGIDHFNNVGPWSEKVSNLLPGHSPPDTLLHFNQELFIESIAGEDINPGSYAIDSNNTIPGNSYTLALFGNTWKAIEIDPFIPDTSTTLQIFTKTDSLSDVQAIGFANESNFIRYSISGHNTLDIEQWIPVYQGSNELGNWNSYRLPLGDDWLAWHDSLSPINQIQFINEHEDMNSSPGSIHFSMIRDITADLPISPIVSIQYETESIQNDGQNRRMVVSFSSTVQDTDSYSFTYRWEFGDGQTSSLQNPEHEYLIEDNHEYTVVLEVEDETGQHGWASTTINLNHGNSTFPLTMNFVGDIMMGRRYEESDGIITTQGVQSLFEPTRNLLGMAADLSIANLEIPLSNQGYPHPTKGIVFRCAPENVSGLVYGGIDVVSLANNHILDYMEPAMIQTQNILNEAGIAHSGSGMNSYEAYLPIIKSVKGQVIAFLASSDRTGQYNNYQPYLNAGENKSGFAYMTPYYLRQQINSVESFADLIVMEMHAGSEYSHAPGSDYDSISRLADFKNMKTNPASSIGFQMTPDQENEIDDYSWRLDRPKLWDRAIRHFAIDEGADLVVVHHPHIIQGLEVYNGKLIAHSLGNFIFDLNYPETYPSMILNSKADESGFTEFMIDPVYIDDYLTVPAKGELGNQILSHIANLSNDLDTYVHVDKDYNKAYVIMDTSSMVVDMIHYNSWTKSSKPIQLNGQSYFQSEPIPLSSAGSLASISDGHPSITHFRIGREKVWMKNFENEGSTLWNINSENEMIQDSIFRRGQNALLHIRSPESPNNIVTNLEERLPFDNQKQHSLHGYIKTENAKNVSIEARLSVGRTGESLITASIGDSVSGSLNWKKYWNDIPYTEEAEFFDIRSNSDIPDSGLAYSWFDDVGFIEWDTLKLITEYPISINYPNDYDYIQFYHDQEQTDYFGLELKNAILGPLAPLNANPKVTQNIIFVPDHFHFFDESSGPVGDRNWIFDSEEFGFGQTTSLFCNEPGIYEITLRVRGIGDLENEETISVFALEQGSNQHDMGDVNGDGSITSLDALLCVNSIFELYTLQPIEFLAADIDGTGSINIYDVLFILDGAN